MKRLSKAVIAFAIICSLLVPAVLYAQAMPRPMEQTVKPGTTTIAYMGDTFVFTTSVALNLKFLPTSPSVFELTVSVRHVSGDPQMNFGTTLQIFWEDQVEVLYDDDPPVEPWTGIVDTGEGGWTEK